MKLPDRRERQEAGIAGVLAMVLSIGWVAMCIAFSWSVVTIYAGAVLIGAGMGAAINWALRG